DGCSAARDAAVPQTAIVPIRQRHLIRCIPDRPNGTSPPFLTRWSVAPSFHLFQQLPRFTQQRPYLPSLGDRIPREQAVLARLLVCRWRAGSLCAAMHAAAILAVHRRRAARIAGTGLGATTRARQHRAGISDVIAHACASRLASAESCPRLEGEAFDAFLA